MDIRERIKAIFSNPIVRNVFLAIIISSIMIFIPQFIGFGKEGFTQEEILKQFQFYTNTGWGFLLILTLAFIALQVISRVAQTKKEFEKYKYSLAFASQGENPSPVVAFRNASNTQIFLLSMIVFSMLGFVNFITKQTVFTGVGKLAQQFTATDNILFSSALVPVAENLGAALVIALSLLTLIILAVKNNWTEGTFKAISIIFIPILVGFYGLSNHLLRYGASDYNLLTVFVFWWLGGLMTVMVGSFIPFWIMHLTNNLFLDLKTYFSNEAVIVWVLFVWIILVFTYVVVYIYLKRKRKQSKLTVNI